MSTIVKNGQTKPRVVLDSNVLISAIVFGGKPRKLLDSVADRSITIVIAEELLTETRRIIVSKFPDFLEDLQRIEKLLKRDGILVKLGSINVTVSRDPDDDKFIETAILGGCQYIVSGDKDLLTLESYENIQIVTVATFLDILNDS